MPDDERIELMIRVKEGKLSMHDAVEQVTLMNSNNTLTTSLHPWLADLAATF